MIVKSLDFNYQTRITIDAILSHPYFTKEPLLVFDTPLCVISLVQYGNARFTTCRPAVQKETGGGTKQVYCSVERDLWLLLGHRSLRVVRLLTVVFSKQNKNNRYLL